MSSTLKYLRMHISAKPRPDTIMEVGKEVRVVASKGSKPVQNQNHSKFMEAHINLRHNGPFSSPTQI